MSLVLRRKGLLGANLVTVKWYAADGTTLLKTEMVKTGTTVIPQSEISTTDNYTTYVCTWDNYSDSDFIISSKKNFIASTSQKRLYLFRSGYGNNTNLFSTIGGDPFAALPCVFYHSTSDDGDETDMSPHINEGIVTVDNDKLEAGTDTGGTRTARYLNTVGAKCNSTQLRNLGYNYLNFSGSYSVGRSDWSIQIASADGAHYASAFINVQTNLNITACPCTPYMLNNIIGTDSTIYTAYDSTIETQKWIEGTNIWEKPLSELTENTDYYFILGTYFRLASAPSYVNVTDVFLTENKVSRAIRELPLTSDYWTTFTNASGYQSVTFTTENNVPCLNYAAAQTSYTLANNHVFTSWICFNEEVDFTKYSRCKINFELESISTNYTNSTVYLSIQVYGGKSASDTDNTTQAITIERLYPGYSIYTGYNIGRYKDLNTTNSTSAQSYEALTPGEYTAEFGLNRIRESSGYKPLIVLRNYRYDATYTIKSIELY